MMVYYGKDVDAIEGWSNAGEVNINHRFGVGRAEACGIEISRVEENQEEEVKQGGLRGIRAFLMASLGSLVGFLP